VWTSRVTTGLTTRVRAHPRAGSPDAVDTAGKGTRLAGSRTGRDLDARIRDI
jgi:hypothetical protein